MKLQRSSTDSLGPAKILFASKLPPEIVDRAVSGLCWISTFAAVTSVLLTAIKHFLQPEFAEAWSHWALRLVSLGVLATSIGFMAVQRKGWLSKERLLDLGLVYQVAIAFAAAMFETAVDLNRNSMVIGYSGIAVWMILCGLLLPNAPLRVGLTALASVAAWPLAYRINLAIYGHPPIPTSQLLLWTLPLLVTAVWMYVINCRVISSYLRQQRAEDIGSYTLDFRLGFGGMGEVWRAKHRTLARDAAVKLIRPEVLRTSTAKQEDLIRRRFEREAQATASLRSPHTVALYDFGRAKDGSFYYVMELLDGIDLQTLVDRFGAMPPSRVVHIISQVAQSLEEAHAKGLVHRDIKPRNILLCQLGLQYDFAKVLDFGLVKSLWPDQREVSMLTLEGVTTGTPAYMPPEIALGNRPVDERADLYSLGCVAYFLLAGRMVFEETTPTAYAIAHVQTPPRPMSETSEMAVPPALESLVMQLLEKDPANRVQSARELNRRLRAIREIPQWCPDEAADWWRINLPDTPARRRPEKDPAGVETQTVASPVGVRL